MTHVHTRDHGIPTYVDKAVSVEHCNAMAEDWKAIVTFAKNIISDDVEHVSKHMDVLAEYIDNVRRKGL
tara:strand:+ start:146 stop:352 length:207 start_codon:yes stop_codon:yes gene_type:complete